MPGSGSYRDLWVRWKSLKLPWRQKWVVGQDLSGTLFYEHRSNPLSATLPRRSASYPYNIHPGDVLLTPAWMQWLRNTRPNPPSIQEQQQEMQRQSNLKMLAQRADQRWNEQKSYLDRPAETGQAPAEVLEPRDRGGYGQVDPRGLGTPGSRGPEAQGGGKGLDAQFESSGMKSVTGSQEETIQQNAEGRDVVKGRFKGPGGPTDPRERDSDSAGSVNREIPREPQDAGSASQNYAQKKKKENPWERKGPSEGWQPQSWTPPPAARR